MPSLNSHRERRPRHPVRHTQAIRMKRPCIGCGEPIDNGTYCPSCRPTQTGNRSHPLLHTARWERLSKRLRKFSPFCENCGSTEQLSVDHIIPVTQRPDLIFELANLRVLCMRCNRQRGSTCTNEERAMVEQRMDVRRQRRIRCRAYSAIPTTADRPDKSPGHDDATNSGL
ncbi:HNH endonuclease signature motif containing protein [Mycolicibacterium nivoides]|uniref:HNH endonuclease signature motif containing protein n=1 Tax=Mycolicibacterium nivoides TaxID=2487344 RepID=UPI000F5BFF34